MPNFWSGLLNAGTAAATGYAQGDAANLRALVAEKARREKDARQARLDAEQSAIHAATMRKQGFVPNAERGADSMTLLPGSAIADLTSLATGGVTAPTVATPPDAKAKRYGAPVGGYSYDKASPEAAQETAKLDQTMAATRYMNQRPDLARAATAARAAEGQANRESRESIAANANASHELVARNREAAKTAARSALAGKPVTGSARLNAITSHARALMRPSWQGGAGMNPTLARQAAVKDIDDIIASGGGGTGATSPTSASAGAPNAPPAARPSGDPGGDVNLGAPETSGIAFPKTSAPGAAAPTTGRARHPLEVADDAEQLIRNGKATLEQALASPYLSDPVKAVLKRKFQTP